MGVHPSFLPLVLASVSGQVGWGDCCGRRLHPPDLTGILRDGSVTGELARTCNVPDNFPCPFTGILGREAISVLSCSPSSLLPWSLGGLKHHSVGLWSSQTCLTLPQGPHIFSIRKAPLEHTPPSYPQSSHCSVVAKDPSLPIQQGACLTMNNWSTCPWHLM